MLFAGCAEVRKDFGGHDVCESVESGSLSRVLKRHLPSVHVQHHSYHRRFFCHIERLPRGCAGFVLSISKPDRPKSLCWRQHMFTLPVNGFTGNS